MRDSIILNNEFEFVLIREAKKGDYVKALPKELLGENDWLSPNEEERIELALHKKITKEKIQKVLQMVLLYDKIILPCNNDFSDFSNLINTGNFDIRSYDDMQEGLGINKFPGDIDYDYSQIIKPALIYEMKETVKHLYYKRVDGFTDYKFASMMYDLLFSQGTDRFQKLMNTHYDFISSNAIIHMIRHMNNPIYSITSTGDYVKDYLQEMIQIFAVHVEALLWDMKLSSEYNATIVNTNYRIEKLGYNHAQKLKDRDSIYNTLKIELSNYLGYMPKFESFHDVLRIKDKQRQDIKRLQNVISELEATLVECGNEKMITQAVNNVSKANKELLRLKQYEKVSKWTTYLSIPIAVSEIVMQLPPILGMSLAGIGTSATLKAEHSKKQSGWVSVIR